MTEPVLRPQMQRFQAEFAEAFTKTEAHTLAFVGAVVTLRPNQKAVVTLSYQKVGIVDPCVPEMLSAICTACNTHIRNTLALIRERWNLVVDAMPRVSSITPGRVPVTGAAVMENVLCISFSVRRIEPTYLNHLEAGYAAFQGLKRGKHALRESR